MNRQGNWFQQRFVVAALGWLLVSVVAGCAAGHPGKDGRAGTLRVSGRFTALLEQRALPVLQNAQLRGDIFDGELVVTSREDGTQQRFDWWVEVDPETLTMQSMRSIELVPGVYDLSLLVSRGSQIYAAQALAVEVREGASDLPLTLAPVIGETRTTVTGLRQLVDLALEFDRAEIDAARLAQPRVGVRIDYDQELIFAIGPYNRIDLHVSVPRGEHPLRLALYDGVEQVGRSLPGQETRWFEPGEDMTMDIVPLHGSVRSTLDVTTGAARFDFRVPFQVIYEAGGLENLEVQVVIAGEGSALVEADVDLQQSDASGDLVGELHFEQGFQYGDVALSLNFVDRQTGEIFGRCVVEDITLDSEFRVTQCEMVLRRRSVIGSRLLGVVGINVIDQNSRPVAGAVVSLDGQVMGITGEGSFGAPGHLKLTHAAGEFTARAVLGCEDRVGTGEAQIAILPLGVHNLVIQIDTADAPEVCEATAPDIDMRRSLVVTERSILDQGFGLERVLAHVAATAGTTQTPSALFSQTFDTFARLEDSVSQDPSLPHCDDEGATLNGFPVECPRTGEANLARPENDPFSNPAFAYAPIGLFNRFDLAPVDGSHCGEYRIVYGKQGGSGGRNLIIFEAQLPNPSPGCGVTACRPVAEFWAELSTVESPVERAARLEAFYFEGLDGFRPVVHARNYGPDGGQLRGNHFVGGNWQLREWKVAIRETQGVVFEPAPVAGNPFPALMGDASDSPLQPDFQEALLSQVPALAVNDLNGFGMKLPTIFDAAQSTVSGGPDGNSYEAFMGQSIEEDLAQTLTDMGSDLEPAHIARRMTAVSCAGCHQSSNNVDLGGGLTWPGSLGFVHILETATEAAPQGGLRHRLSPALLDEFLPHREQVLEDFLSNTACLSLNCQPGDVLPVTDSGEPEHPVDCLGGARQGH